VEDPDLCITSDIATFSSAERSLSRERPWAACRKSSVQPAASVCIEDNASGSGTGMQCYVSTTTGLAVESLPRRVLHTAVAPATFNSPLSDKIMIARQAEHSLGWATVYWRSAHLLRLAPYGSRASFGSWCCLRSRSTDDYDRVR
jgi:hypothetical protein